MWRLLLFGTPEGGSWRLASSFAGKSVGSQQGNGRVPSLLPDAWQARRVSCVRFGNKRGTPLHTHSSTGGSNMRNCFREGMGTECVSVAQNSDYSAKALGFQPLTS